MLDFTAMQTALVAWVRGATGLPAGTVMLAEQSGWSPDEMGEDPFATLRLGQFVPDAPTDETVRIDHSADFPAPANGQELENRVLAYGVLVVTLQLFSAKAVGAGSAMDLAIRARSALSLPSVRSALDVAGLAVANAGAPLSAATVLDRRWRGRAALDVRFNVCDTVSERLGYIASVSGTMTLKKTESDPGTTQSFSVNRSTPP